MKNNIDIAHIICMVFFTTKIYIIMTIHLAIQNRTIWCAGRMSEIDRIFGRDCAVIHKGAPSELEKFLKQNPDQKEVFFQGFAYWVICKVFNKQEKQGLYGMLKRKLKNFSEKLFRSIRSIASRLAHKVRERL